MTILIGPDHLDAISMAARSYQFQASITGSSDTAVTWSIEENPPDNIRDGTIDSTGLYTPPQQGAYSFVCHVVATSHADPTKTARAVVNVWGDLVDHGGPVAPALRVFVVWWGDAGAFASDDRAELEGFLKGLSGSPYLAIADQYLRGAKASVALAGTFFDSSAPPAGNPPLDTLDQVACGALRNNHVQIADGDLVLVNSTSTSPNFCGSHFWMTCQGRDVLLGYMPNQAGLCSDQRATCGKGHTAESVGLVGGVAHELIEAITDPHGNAWNSAGEIADRCGLPICLSLPTGTFSVGTIYSNQVHGCAGQ